MRTAIIIAIFAIITIIVGLLPANGADPFGLAPAASGYSAAGR